MWILNVSFFSPHLQKADKSALEGKVSRVQFDSMTEQLNVMFQELQSRVTDQTQDWHRVKEKLSSDVDCKVRRAQGHAVSLSLVFRCVTSDLLTCDVTTAAQDGVGVCEEAAGRLQEEHSGEAAESGSCGAGRRCRHQEVRRPRGVRLLGAVRMKNSAL